MGELLLVLIVAVLLMVPVALTVAVFVTARALVVGRRRRLAGAGLAAALMTVAAGLALLFGGVSDSRCTASYAGRRNLEAASIEQSSGLWPPVPRCRYEFADGLVETYRPDFDGVWVAAAMTAVFAAAMGLLVVGRQFSKKGDMLF